MFLIKTLLSLFLAGQVAAHGHLDSPPIRDPGATNQIWKSDINSGLGYLDAARNPNMATLWPCINNAPPTSTTNTFAVGESYPFHWVVTAPHPGTCGFRLWKKGVTYPIDPLTKNFNFIVEIQWEHNVADGRNRKRHRARNGVRRLKKVVLFKNGGNVTPFKQRDHRVTSGNRANGCSYEQDDVTLCSRAIRA